MITPDSPFSCSQCEGSFVEIIEPKPREPSLEKMEIDEEDKDLDQGYNKMVFRPGENREDMRRP